jgi:asparagine synthase (glutamine-hydrolysing)
MCGLYASIGFEPDQDRLDIVSYRGPDGRGWKEYASACGPVALGHRRLAIIDISAAAQQPMSDASGRFHIVFNGEIYNYLEIRDELEATGEVFSTQSDTEVLLLAYARWRSDALEKLRGMFSFLVWDQREKRLFAARDRFGIKPLYYTYGLKGAAFASEIKQLLGLPGISGRMSQARVHDYLESGISDHTSETMFEGVFQLRGGECLEISVANGGAPVLQIRRWYSATAGDLSIGEDEAGKRFRYLLSDSVRLHMRADVSIGSCLSGGLDSSSIVCLMSDMLSKVDTQSKVNTVSACYSDKSVDEKAFMDAVVDHAQTQPHFVYPKACDVFAKAADITWHQDEPFGSTSIFAQWCVFEEAKRAGIKVLLDGQGADEQLAGYHSSSFGFYMAGLARRGQFGQILRTIAERRKYHGAPVTSQVRQQLISMLPPAFSDRLRRSHHAVKQHNWLGSALLEEKRKGPNAQEVANAELGLPPVTDIRSLCMTQTYGSNLGMLLHWEDRNSMAHSVEARVPFLDHPLVEFSLSLGNDHKVVGADTKRVLRRAMHGILPEAVRDRRDKLGFSTPEQAWFQGPLREVAHEGVEQTLALYPDLLNAKGVRALVSEMLSGRRPIDFALWRMINLGIWGRTFGVTI